MESTRRNIGSHQNTRSKEDQIKQLLSVIRKMNPVEVMMGRNVKFCGRIHKPRECPAYGQECRKFKKKNHWASCCYTRKVHEASAEPTEDFVIEEVETSKENTM